MDNALIADFRFDVADLTLRIQKILPKILNKRYFDGGLLLVHIESLNINFLLIVWHSHGQDIDGHPYFNSLVNLLRLFHIVVDFPFDFEHLPYLDIGLFDRIPVLHHLVPAVVIGIIKIILAGVVLESKEPAYNFDADVADGETDLHGEHIPAELAVLDREEPTYSTTMCY